MTGIPGSHRCDDGGTSGYREMKPPEITPFSTADSRPDQRLGTKQPSAGPPRSLHVEKFENGPSRLEPAI